MYGTMVRTVAAIAAAVLLLVATGCTTGPGSRGAQDGRAAGGEGSPDRAAEYYDSDLTRGLGLPFSEAVRVGDLLILSGMVGTRPGTLELVPGGLEAESRQALENIRHMVEAAGGSIEDIVKCTVMLEDISQWSAFNRIYVEFFGDHRPARSAFGADGLALGAAVEVECIAAARGASAAR